MPSPFVIRISAGILLAGALASWGGPRQAPETGAAALPVPDPSPTSDPPSTNEHVEASEVFQRVFWKRPTANDHILHAEQHAWSGDDGIRKWRWFIALRPSPELVKHLRDDNAFGLVPAVSAPRIVDAPAWFTFRNDEVEVLRAPSGSLVLVIGKEDKTLYATGTGGGFQPGIPEPAEPPVPPVIQEVLPPPGPHPFRGLDSTGGQGERFTPTRDR